MNRQMILDHCIRQLRDLPPVETVRLLKEKTANPASGEHGLLEIKTKVRNQIFQYTVRGELKRPLPLFFSNRLKTDLPIILISGHVNPSIAADLREKGLNFIDVQGNAHIHIKNFLFIDREGRKPVSVPQEKYPSIFNPKGMQLLYILLIDKTKLDATVRTLASLAGVSKDRASSGMRELRRTGRIIETAKNHFLFSDKQSLLEQWLSHYNERFRSSLILGSYRMAPSIEENLPVILASTLPGNRYAIGGARGSDLLIPHYKGLTAEIYIQPEDIATVQKALKLIPSAETNITLFRLFSDEVIFHETDIPYSVAHPLLIYSELLFRKSDRAEETAQLIFDQFLNKMIHET